MIREALTVCALDRLGGTLRVGHAQFDPVVIAEGVFIQVALEMLLASVLVDAVEAALEHAEETFNAVRGDELAVLPAGILFFRVIDRLASRKALAAGRIETAFVCVQRALGVGVPRQHFFHVL